MNISRRRAVRSTLFTVAALSQLRIFAQGSLGQSASPTPVDPLQTLFQPMDAATLSALDQFFVGYRIAASLKSILPFTAVLKNGGRSPVKAYEMSWVHNAKGVDTTLFATMFESKPSLSGSSAIATGWNTIVNPGEYAVVTPLFLWSASKYKRHGGAIPIVSLANQQSAAQAFISSTKEAAGCRVRRNAKICRRAIVGSNSVKTLEYKTTLAQESRIATALVTAAGVPEGLDLAASEWLSSIDSSLEDLDTRVSLRYLQSVLARVRVRGAHVAWTATLRIASRGAGVLAQRERVRLATTPA